MQLKQIALAEINNYQDKPVIVHWTTGNVMVFEFGYRDEDVYDDGFTGEGWFYQDASSGEVFKIDIESDNELIESVYIIMADQL